MISKGEKISLFETVRMLECLGENQDRSYDNTNYVEQSNGAYAMLQVLGLTTEYINWTYKKYKGRSK